LWKELYTLDDSVEHLSGRISVFADVELLRDFLQQPLKREQSSGDINDGPFAKTAIAQRNDLVSKHFQQYTVLYVSLKVNWLVLS
jgi:hypothetical protein